MVDVNREKVLAYALSLTGDHALASDLTQEAFYVAFNSFDKFDEKRCFTSWVKGILRNRFLRHVYRKNREVSVDPNCFDCMVAPVETDREPCYRALENGLAQLPEGDRNLLDLIYYQKMKPKTIAANRGVTANSIYVQAHRARARLRDLIKNKTD